MLRPNKDDALYRCIVNTEPRRLSDKFGAAWIAANAAGIALFVVGDSDARLFSLSREHGPSITEAAGVLLILVAWVWLDVAALGQRPVRIWSTLARISAGLGVAIGLVVLITAVLLDWGPWWVLGATLLAGVQLAVAISASIRQ